MKKLFLIFLIYFGLLVSLAYSDDTYSYTSLEDETGATEMRGSFVDGQAWFHDAGGLIAAYAGTGNLLIATDPTLKAYGFIGEVGTGETLGAEALDDPTLNDAAEWNDDDGNVTHNDVAGTVTWDGLGAGDFLTIDGAGQFTVKKLYKIVIVVDSMTAGAFYISSGAWAFQGTAIAYYDSAGTKTEYRVCSNDLGFKISTNAACNAVISNISIKEVTEPNANAVHIYKEAARTTEGWNAIDTGIDYNAGAAWDFDVYINLLSRTGLTIFRLCNDDFSNKVLH